MKVRFDNWNVGGQFQRVFDFGNGPLQDNIVLSQFQDTQKMFFALHDCADGTDLVRLVTDDDVIEDGVVVTWKVGLDPSGLMYMIKDGVLQESQNTTCVPRNVNRLNKLLGESNWIDNEPLHGAVLGIRVRNLPGTLSLSDIEFQNIPGKVRRARFTASMYARFDTLDRTEDQPQGSQHIFDFSASADGNNNTHQIYFAQIGTTADVEFGVEHNGIMHKVKLPNVITLNEFAFWHVAVRNQNMSIEKNNNESVSEYKATLDGSLEAHRQSKLIGESRDSLKRPLDGVVLGLRVD